MFIYLFFSHEHSTFGSISVRKITTEFGNIPEASCTKKITMTALMQGCRNQGARGTPAPSPLGFWQISLAQGGHIMPITLLREPPNFQTFLRPCYVHVAFPVEVHN